MGTCPLILALLLLSPLPFVDGIAVTNPLNELPFQADSTDSNKPVENKDQGAKQETKTDTAMDKAPQPPQSTNPPNEQPQPPTNESQSKSGKKQSKKDALLDQFVRHIDGRDPISADGMIKPLSAHTTGWILINTPAEKMKQLFEMLPNNRLASLFHGVSSHRGARLLLRQQPQDIEPVLGRLPAEKVWKLRYWIRVERKEIVHKSIRSRHVDRIVAMLNDAEKSKDYVLAGELMKIKMGSAYCVLRDMPDNLLPKLLQQVLSPRNAFGLLSRFSRSWQLKVMCRYQAVDKSSLDMLLDVSQASHKKLAPKFKEEARKLRKLTTRYCRESQTPAQQPPAAGSELAKPRQDTQQMQLVPYKPPPQSLALVPYKPPSQSLALVRYQPRA